MHLKPIQTLKNGNVLFCDALTQTKKYLSLNCSKDPIVELAHDKLNSQLIVRVESAKLFHIQYYSLPELELRDEVFCPKTLTAYGRLGRNVLLGFSDGSLEMLEAQAVNTTETFNRVPSKFIRFWINFLGICVELLMIHAIQKVFV
jgi:hypothetical protein